MSSVARDLWSDYTPYGQLVSALLPRAAGLTVFETSGEIRWTSEQSVHPALPALVKSALAAAENRAEPGVHVQLADREPAYLFWLHNRSNAITAVVAIPWRAGEGEQRTFKYVHSMARPILECLSRELLLQESVSAANSGEERDSDLEVLLATSGTSRREGGDDDVRALLQAVTDHMRCEFSALIVPERNLVVVAKPEGRTVDTGVLARLHRPLLSLTHVRNAPVILNAPDALPGLNLPLRALAIPLRGSGGRTGGMLVLFRTHATQEFRQREAQLAELLARRAANIIDASYDALTGLLTRDAFEQRARMLLDARTEGRRMQWTGLYLDTDRMHVINDNYGMHVGDKLLARLGELVRTRLVPGALAARISGDRFAILLPTAPEDAMTFAEALRAGVEGFSASHLGVTESSFSASVSIGVAAIVDPRIDFAHAFAVAETACKAAKDRGRNRVELYQASDVSIVRRYEDVNIAPSLRAAITENRLRLDAQLIAPLRDPKAGPHFELLLRMIDDNGEIVGPGRFLSAAVRYQIMPAVDRWVVQEAVRVLQPHAALLTGRPVVFTVNISGQSLGEDGFDDYLYETIRDSGVNPKVFCFELTESAAIANLAKAETMMKRLRTLGCSFALDDFGTGLSSLAYLRALPVDMLKIDGSFVKDILTDPRAESMVQAIAQLARSIQLTTVAEFVETDEIRLHVAQLGVDYGQGFAISRPAPLMETIAELPAYEAAARRHQVETPQLGPNDDTQRRIEKMLETYDHAESTLYQRA